MSTLTLDPTLLSEWIGRSEEHECVIHAQPARFMQTTLDRAPTLELGDTLPLCWHWLYFLEASRTSELGRDGHAALGGFLPPVDLPRRMWAGSRLVFHQPITIGDKLKKVSTIKDLKIKSGKTGTLCFVTVSHLLCRGENKLITEEHDIVYREDPSPDAPAITPPVAPTDARLTRTIDPSPVFLFRYSALTFNGHRIHYDLDYCRNVEGYPDLVVHGPLSATLLLDLASQDVASEMIHRFDFRAVSPLFADRPFTINLKGDNELSLWATNPDGFLAVDACVKIHPTGGSN